MSQGTGSAATSHEVLYRGRSLINRRFVRQEEGLTEARGLNDPEMPSPTTMSSLGRTTPSVLCRKPLTWLSARVTISTESAACIGGRRSRASAELAFYGFYLARQDHTELHHAEYLSVRHIQRAFTLHAVVVERVVCGCLGASIKS